METLRVRTSTLVLPTIELKRRKITTMIEYILIVFLCPLVCRHFKLVGN